MKLLKNFAITGSLGLIAFAGLASASTISYDANLGANGFYNGTGNTGDHFATLDDGNLQLALKIVNRYTGSPTIDPTLDNYDYNGAQNVDPTKQWAFEFSIDTRNGGGTGTVGDYTYSLSIFDNTTGTQSASGVFDPLSIADNAYYDGTGVHGGSSNNNDAATQAGFYGVQNAEWPAYIPFFGDGTSASWNPHDTYTVTLSALANTQGATPDTLSVRVNGTPEPGTILTMLGSLGALGLFVRRRKA
ncbi:MAG TPA: PEP-CTERM sorting domain-containing protein [Bryobacteraceae bacterium]|jgi:hypothetical protein